MLSDFHLHSLVSDGEMDPVSVVTQAAARGVRRLAITDHDTLAAYRWEGGLVFEVARRCGLELVVGIELDVALDGREVHLLGLGVDLEAPALLAHLEAVREARRERARRELALVRERLGEAALTAADVFAPGRETLMRPHLIRPLVEKGRFRTYQDGRQWFHAHARTGVVVPKPTLAEALALIHRAGGQAVLAHPGYYWKDGLKILEALPALRAAGLDGVELDYPYRSNSPDLFDEADERTFTRTLTSVGESLGLRLTRGSDCHRVSDFDRVYGPARA